MHILLTGAMGFLGSYILKDLLKANYQVSIIKREGSDCSRITTLLGQVTTYHAENLCYSELFQKTPVDAIIHTATAYGSLGESASEILTSNTLFPLQLFEAALAANTPYFFNAASSLPAHLNFYASSKILFSHWAEKMSQRSRTSLVNVILELMIGPGDRPQNLPTHLIRQCLSNKPEISMTPGEQKRDFIHVEDVSTAFLLLLKTSLEGKSLQSNYAVGMGKAASIRKFAELIHQLCQSQSQLTFSAIPYRNNELMLSEADTSAIKSLGWKPTYTLKEALKNTISSLQLEEVPA